MERRAFLVALAGAAASAPRAHGQRMQRPARIAFLTYSTEVAWLATFKEALSSRGYVEGRDLIIEVRAANGRSDRLASLAIETVDERPDVIVATATPAVNAAVHATQTIPIVMATAGDALGTGHVKNLARPGGNVTGLSLSLIELAGKTTGLLVEALPHVKRIACIVHRGDPLHAGFAAQAEATTRRLGLQIVSLDVGPGGDMDLAFSDVARRGAGGVVLQPIFLLEGNVPTIVRAQFAYQMPTISGLRRFADAGGLAAYASEFPDLGWRTAGYVDRILRGAKPGDLPVEQPSRFNLVFNLKSAHALGVTIPNALLARADAVLR